MKLFRSILTVGGLTACSRILGFIRDMLIALHLGAGPLADIFFVAFKFPNFFRRLFAEGAFSVTFVPLFSRLYVDRGLPAATAAAEQIFAVLLTFLLVFVAGVEVLLPWIMYGLAPGFSQVPEHFQRAIELSRVTFPYILFISLASFFSGILNSMDRFGVGAAAPVLLNFTMIGVLVFFLSYFPTPAHGLAWAVVGGGLLQYLWTSHALRRRGVKIRWVWPRLTPSVRHLLRGLLPGAMGAGIMQVNLFVDVILASFLPSGAVSYLFYADRLTQLPLSIVGIATSTAMLPVLSKHVAKNEVAEAREVKNRTLELSLFFSLPATIALMILSVPLLSVLFERGAFGPAQALEAGYTLSAYAFGLPAYVIGKLFSASFFAQHDTRTPVKVGILCMVLNIVLNFLLMVPFKHVGIAGATALSAWVNVILLGWALRRQRLFIVDSRLKRRVPRIVFASLALGLVLLGLCVSAGEILRHHSLEQALVLMLIMGMGLGAYMIFSYLFRAIDLQEMRSLLKA